MVDNKKLTEGITPFYGESRPEEDKTLVNSTGLRH